MKQSSTAVAYPGLPVIFAEGFQDHSQRLSHHNSVGCALSNENGSVKTETTVEEGGRKTSLVVDQKRVSDVRGKGMLRVVELMKKKARYVGGLKIRSTNQGIQTGSSDSGAAALVYALNDFFELNLPPHTLLNVGRYGSETVFRSLYGGLSEYIVDGVREPVARELASPGELSGITAFGVDFGGKRYSADELHLKVVSHERYPLRRGQVKERTDSLRMSLREGDLEGVLGVMESDARTFHEMIEELGMRVRGDGMLGLCHKVELWRGTGVPVYWNVAGGPVVYVFTLTPSQHEITAKLRGEKLDFTKYKIAGGPKIL